MKYFGWIFLFFIMVYILPLGSRPMLSPAEFQHAEIAREMVVNSKYAQPVLLGNRISSQPPMSYWLTAGSIKLFGENNFAVRLPSAAAVGLIALMIALLIQQTLRDEKLAALASMIFMASSLPFAMGSTAQKEIIFSLFASGAAGTWFLAAQETVFNRRKLLLLVLCGIFTGTAFLTDGFAALIFPALIIASGIPLKGRIKDTMLSLLPALLFAILTVLPWAMTVKTITPGYWQEFISWQNFTSGIGSFSWYWYILALLAGFIPMFVLVPVTIFVGKESWQRLIRQPLCRFSISSLVMPVLYLLIVRNASPGIILLSFPALGILLAMGIQAYFNNGGHHRSFDWMLNIWALLLIIAGIIEIIAWYMQNSLLAEYFSIMPVTRLFLINLGIASIIGGSIMLYSLRGNWRSRLYLFFFSVAILPLGISWCIDSDRNMPEKSFRTFINNFDILPEKTVFVTEKKYMPAMAWINKHTHVHDIANGIPECATQPVCIIMDLDSEAWNSLPKPDKDEICNNFRAAVYYRRSTDKK